MSGLLDYSGNKKINVEVETLQFYWQPFWTDLNKMLSVHFNLLQMNLKSLEKDELQMLLFKKQLLVLPIKCFTFTPSGKSFPLCESLLKVSPQITTMHLCLSPVCNKSLVRCSEKEMIEKNTRYLNIFSVSF